jgi:hypothetical protein
MHRRLIRAGLVVAALTLAAGAAYGAIPSSNGTVTGCVDSKGSLKVIDAEAGATCAAAAKTLVWNKQGPTGPQGETGPQGPPGPSNAYYASTDQEVVLSTAAAVANLNLPAGSYVLSAKVSLFDYSGQGVVTCQLQAFTGSDTQKVLMSSSNHRGEITLMLPIGSWIDFGATLSCDPGGIQLGVNHVRLIAIKVGNLTHQ